MSLVNTINFLPEVFQSSTNQRFLGATLDQLVTGAVNTPVNGYIGRTFAPTYKFGDNYVPELTTQRTNYQLEASVVVRNKNQNIEFNAGYIDLLDSINRYGGLTNNHQRLFRSESYSYDGHFDYDKFVNYYNYYWLPNGPDSVELFANQTPYTEDFTVVRNTNVNGYVFSGHNRHPNVQLTLARGGTYTFTVDQPGYNFWIQSTPGVTGVDPNVSTINTRQVYGVTNNGTDSGKITFKVPLATAQDFYTTMPIVKSVDAAVDLHYADIQGKLLSEFLTEYPQGFDGVNNQLQNKTFIFINNDVDDSFWQPGGLFDLTGYNGDTLFDPGTIVTEDSGYRTAVWKIDLVPMDVNNSDYLIHLLPTTVVTYKQKIFVTSGKTHASNEFWLDNNSRYQRVPLITANKEYLYYQDSNNPNFIGVIKLVDNASTPINADTDIIGSIGYTSPNGVEFTNGLKVKFDSYVTPSTYADREFYVEGVGTNISLVPVDQLVVPETIGANIDTTEDYITISRASSNLNPWSRYNRWFHKDVINATAAYNDSIANFGPNLPGRRPIIEFEPNLQLINYGRQAKNSINYIVLEPTDAFNDIEGKVTASIDSIPLKNGDRIVFANDYDTNIINEVWEVQIRRINSTNYVTLIQTPDDPVLPEQNILVTDGSHAGVTYKFTGTSWIECQVKTDVNQHPLFDLVDTNGYSFTDTTVYPGTTFAGTKIFGYKVSTSTDDAVLGFPLTYQNFNNIGDIVFNNYYDSDTFTYTANQTRVTVNCNTGYLNKSTNLTDTIKLNNWVVNKEQTAQFQSYTTFYEGYVLVINGVQRAFAQLDVLPNAQTTVPFLKVYLNNRLLVIGIDYEVTTYGAYDVILFTNIPAIGDKINVEVFSDSVSALGYYNIPENLDRNPLNENFATITLGQLRTHYNKLIENTSTSTTGNVLVQDNYLKNHGGTLSQHSSPVIYAMTFLNDPALNFIDSVTLAKKEYNKFKNKFLSLCSTQAGLDYTNPVTGVDKILQNINALKNSSFPWYYSDMVPQGGNYTTITYKVLNVRQTAYEISSIFDHTVLSNRAVIVYVNNEQQTLGIDYTFSNVTPSINFTRSFVFGDVITIRDYSNTDGNYIPETPSKLGLYPKSVPEIYVDNTYQTPTTVIRGHDGSITPAFGDFRDDYLLELECRIYNNIKANYTSNQVNYFDIVPGRFRTTDYSLTEFNQILSSNFLNWVGANNIDYSENKAYDVNNSWTWNYSNFGDRVDGSLLQGSWRAIYDYWFDTDTPNLTPWEMLGFSSKPTWWETRYGVAPYTRGNTLLWEELETGYIWNDGSSYTDKRFARPGLVDFIPVNEVGELLSPVEIPLITTYNTQLANSAFAVGQQGPAETAWRRSSDYAYSIQILAGLTQPARYFATQFDTSRFFTNTNTGQWSNVDNQKITPSILKINGQGTDGTVTRTSGYINWISDYIKNLGIDPASKISDYFKNLSVQLSYKVSGFTDKKMLTVSAEQTSPNSTSGSVIIPDNNYDVYLNKSVPAGTVSYSAVIVEKTTSGYSVSGYDTIDPFFTIIPSISNNKGIPLTVNDITVRVYQDSTGQPTAIPYGTEFATIQQVADFLISYERYLITRGFIFDQFNIDLQTQQNWTLSVQELLYWAQQGWAPGTIILLNPIANKLSITTTDTIVDEITNVGNGNKVLDQNFLPIKSNNFNVLRTEYPGRNKFGISTLNGSNICYARLNLIRYEHVLVFDNVSDFGDIIYVPNQGTRQSRLKLSGSKSGAWTGALSAPGYVYNSPLINEWKSETDYKLGDIVMYNNFYYTASKNISASTTFDTIQWTRINYTDIQTGLLPSFGSLAQQFDNIYDIDNAPSDETLQAFSGGLIGFRQRQFLTDLGINIPTQTKFYQGYIKEKGSVNAINALTKADFNNITGNVNIYEEWAFRVGQYGGINSNTYREFVLDQSVFTSSPVAFTLTDNYYTANVIANLTTANIYNSSNISNTSTAIYTNRQGPAATDVPSVGYVNLNDVDYTVFDITNFTGSITNMGAGDKVWVAKNADKNWDILRVNETHLSAVSLTYVLDDYAQLEFNRAHNFNTNDTLVLKYFHDAFDGLYTVLDTTHPTVVTIQISNVEPGVGELSPLQTLIRALTIVGSGTVYSLDSARVSTVNNFINTPAPFNGWTDNDRVWVDTATTQGWGVYTFNRPWLSNAATRISHTFTANAKFGTSVRLSSDLNYAYVGSPGTREVYANVVGTGTAVTISNVDVGFGTTIDSHGNILVVGSTANVHVYSHNGATATKLQKITSANVTNITSISLSTDRHWLYVADGVNHVVEAYYTTSNTAPNYSWANKITGAASTSFGNVVQTNSDGTRLIVAAPRATNTYVYNGNVYVYTRTANAFALSQTLSSQHKNDTALFGTSLDIDSAAGNLYIGVPGSTASGLPNGLVERWIHNGSQYVFDQSIIHPNEDVGAFGVGVSVSPDTQVLAVGSLGSPSEERTSFDNTRTVIDSNTTKFVDHILNSGATYVFELVIDQAAPGDNGDYVYAQELEGQLANGDAYGSAIDVARSVIVVGAPSADERWANSAIKTASTGAAYAFNNSTQATAWTLSRQQSPQVDLESISRTFIYNKSNNNILAALDYIDPVKGKVLNSVAKDIDFQLDRDPALYNNGTGTIHGDLHWGPRQVGKIWWNLNTIRYIDYEQDALIYRLNHWGNRFPDSSIDVYEWVESSVLPSQYTGTGTPLHSDDSAYCTYGYVDSIGTVRVKYYFWVANLDTVSESAGKTNSVISIAAAIENPQSQGVPYAAILRDDTVALYNVNQLLTGQNSVLQLGSKIGTPSLIHSEYALVQEGNPQSQIPESILLKFVDSLAGHDQLNNEVPDPALPTSQKYGIGSNPRQSMIINTNLALANYLTLVNAYLLDYPIVERKILTTLNSSESTPNAAAGEYDLVVADIYELSYINTDELSNGYKVLVQTDNTNNGKWAIYTLTDGAFPTTPSKLQSYKTNLYWSYTDWYDSNYDSTSIPDLTVSSNLELGKINLVANTYVKVLDNGNGKFAVYHIDSALNKNLVGIESGTLQITTGSIPSTELRQILIAMQTEIFVDDLAVEYNKIFFTMIKYILTEQKNLDWVFKTSFISATQKIRKLEQFASYIPDNQNFYLSYINEVKPYRTVVREFVVDYLGNDTYGSDVTDFDLPPYWDANLSMYRSPNGEQPYDSTVQSTGVYSQWYNNHTFGVVDVQIELPGTGYVLPPQITITGGGGSGATAYSTINSNGGISEIYITNPGTGYDHQPEIIINGTGTGAVVLAVLKNVYDGNNSGHNLVRNIKTVMKFDRVTYTNSNTFVFWSNVTSANVGQTIAANTIIVLENTLYKVTEDCEIYANLDFPVYCTTTISSSSFDNANDRIIAFNGNIDLRNVDDGIDYTGVIVDGGNLRVIDDSATVGSPATVTKYDSYISSAYTDLNGVSPSEIDIDGGAYVDRYESHAPQELMPGRMYDALSFSVFDRDQLAFRIFDTMNQEHEFHRIASDNTAILSQDLALDDEFIYVNDASKLFQPIPEWNQPGVVFINGEKIVYYTRNLVDNKVGQLLRAVDGTSPQAIHEFGTRVVDASERQAIPGANVAPVDLTTSVTYQATNNVTIAIKLTSNITANVGDTIAQIQTIDTWTSADYSVGSNFYYEGNSYVTTGNVYYPTSSWQSNTVFANHTYISNSGSTYYTVGNVYGATFTTPSVTANVRLISNPDAAKFGNIVSSGNVSVIFEGNVRTQVEIRLLDSIVNNSLAVGIVTAGALAGLPEVFDPSLGFDVLQFDNTVSTITINGENTTAFVNYSYILGSVTIDGLVTVPAGTTVGQGNVWYNPGAGFPSDGHGLINSTQVQAEFLKANRGYTP